MEKETELRKIAFTGLKRHTMTLKFNWKIQFVKMNSVTTNQYFNIYKFKLLKYFDIPGKKTTDMLHFQI